MLLPTGLANGSEPWPRHIIDDSSQGADGVRVADVNSDGLLDIATGWEESGITRVYLNPGPGKAQQGWPAVTVGTTPSVEDAVFGDFDQDGSNDVVSSTEGADRKVRIHWGPSHSRYLSEAAWSTQVFPALESQSMWMFAFPVQIDEAFGPDLVLGGKGEGAHLGWLQAPKNPRRVVRWQWIPLRPVGWIMSIRPYDLDGDGDTDLLFSDRKGSRAGVYWLEHPGSALALDPTAWREHLVGARGEECMFLDVGDLDGSNGLDIVVSAKPRNLVLFTRLSSAGLEWQERIVGFPASLGSAKSVRIADIDQDGSNDLVISCEDAGGRSGVVWMTGESARGSDYPLIHDISGEPGAKFDRLETIDLDLDGDLDVLTCEERELNAVLWYENPLR